MPQDAFTLARVATELNALLKTAKVNKINQPDKDEVVLHLYNAGKNYKLLISTNANTARVDLTNTEKPNPLTAFGFCMLLRKHLLTAEIIKVELIGYERIIKITFDAKNDFFERRERALYAEIMGKYSNIVLTEDEKILGSLKAFNLDIGSLRPLCAGLKYTLPIKQDKFYPHEKDYENQLVTLLNDGIAVNLGAFIFEKVIGVSKQTANEIAHLFTLKYGELSAENALNLTDFVVDFFKNFPSNPVIKKSDNGKVKDFLVFDYLSFSGESVKKDSVLNAQSEYYAVVDKNRIFDEKKRKLILVVKKSSDKLSKRQAIIINKKKDASDLESDKIKGELLISNLYRIKSGEEFVVLENYYDEMKPIRITLDKAISPNKNAENYYKRYNKKKRTLEVLVSQEEELKGEIDYIKSLFSEIETAKDIFDLVEIENELKEIGLIKSAKKTGKKKNEKVQYTTYRISGFNIKVGKNNIQNDALLKLAEGNFIWLHAKSFHSSHVFIESKDGVVPDSVLVKAGEICAYYSEVKNGEKIEVDYTLKKFVKKPNGAKPGFVNYTNQKSIVVVPSKNEEFLLK